MLCFLHLFPAVEQFEDFVAVVVFEELAFFLVGDASFLELANIVGFLSKEDYAIYALPCNAGCNRHDLVSRGNGFPRLVWSADVEIDKDGLLEEAFVAAGNGFPVPWGWVGLAEHGDDEVVSILCHGFKVVAESFLAHQRVREAIHEQGLAGDDFFDFGEEVCHCLSSPFNPLQAAFALLLYASRAGAEVLVSEVLATDADAWGDLCRFSDDFEVVFSGFWVGHADYIPAEVETFVGA